MKSRPPPGHLLNVCHSATVSRMVPFIVDHLRVPWRCPTAVSTPLTISEPVPRRTRRDPQTLHCHVRRRTREHNEPCRSSQLSRRFHVKHSKAAQSVYQCRKWSPAYQKRYLSSTCRSQPAYDRLHVSYIYRPPPNLCTVSEEASAGPVHGPDGVRKTHAQPRCEPVAVPRERRELSALKESDRGSCRCSLRFRAHASPCFTGQECVAPLQEVPGRAVAALVPRAASITQLPENGNVSHASGRGTVALIHISGLTIAQTQEQVGPSMVLNVQSSTGSSRLLIARIHGAATGWLHPSQSRIRISGRTHRRQGWAGGCL